MQELQRAKVVEASHGPLPYDEVEVGWDCRCMQQVRSCMLLIGAWLTLAGQRHWLCRIYRTGGGCPRLRWLQRPHAAQAAAASAQLFCAAPQVAPPPIPSPLPFTAAHLLVQP